MDFKKLRKIAGLSLLTSLMMVTAACGSAEPKKAAAPAPAQKTEQAAAPAASDAPPVSARPSVASAPVQSSAPPSVTSAPPPTASAVQSKSNGVEVLRGTQASEE